MNAPRTLCELLKFSVESYRNSRMLNSKIGGQWKSYSSDDVYETVRHLALGLNSLGIAAGDRIAVYAESSAYWTMADFSILHCGAVDIPIYVTQALNQIRFILTNSGARGIFVGSLSLYDRAREAINGSGCEFVVCMSGEKSADGMLTWNELAEKGKELESREPRRFDELRNNVREEDLATIIYTSGTTGEPKGVMLSQKNLVSNVIDCASLFSFNSSVDVVLSYLPPSHVFERMMLYLYVYVGECIYYAESVEALPQDLLEVRPHNMTTVPRMLEKAFEKAEHVVENLPWYKRSVFRWAIGLALRFDQEKTMSPVYRVEHGIASLLVYKDLRHAFGGRVRYIISGGAALRPDLARIFCAAGITILQGYGLTETSPVISVNLLTKNRIGSVGPPIPNVSVRVASDGEILVSGPNVMMGYYRKEDETKEVLSDSWFRTGDIGHVDKDGFLFITDRKKDLLKTSGGKFIAPLEIESMLSRSTYIDKAIVIGDRRKFASALLFPDMEALRNFAAARGVLYTSTSELVESNQVRALFESIVDGVNKELSHWETIKKFAILLDELTIEDDFLTPTLKLKRKNVENRYKEVIEKFYEEKGEGSSRR